MPCLFGYVRYYDYIRSMNKREEILKQCVEEHSREAPYLTEHVYDGRPETIYEAMQRYAIWYHDLNTDEVN